MTEEATYTEFSSDGLSLHLSESLFREYEKEHRALVLKYYAIQRDKFGVWASNQNKFVGSRDQFNKLDSTLMEDLFEREIGGEA